MLETVLNRVVKYEIEPNCVTERTLFKSGVLADCVRYVYSRPDAKELVILDYLGFVKDPEREALYQSLDY